MKRLDDTIAEVKSWQDDIIKVIREALEESELILIDLNRREQLFEQGINSEGVKLQSYQPYTQYTISIKQSKGQPTDRVTLHDTEAFDLSFYVSFGPDSFKIWADDEKTTALVAKYQESIFGLTDYNFNYIAEEVVKPALINYLASL